MLNAGSHQLLFASHPVHVCSVGHDLALHLLVLGVFDQFLVLASATLTNAAEGEDQDGKTNDTADNTDDDVFGSWAEAAPFLRDGLGRRRGIVAIESDWLGVTAADDR
jgi:hypothetical protein